MSSIVIKNLYSDRVRAIEPKISSNIIGSGGSISGSISGGSGQGTKWEVKVTYTW